MCVAAVTLPMVTRLPAVPLRLKSPNVFVVAAVKRTDVGCTVFVMLVNVFEPVIVKAPAPPWLRVQLYVDPPPTKVLAVAAVMEIMPVPVPAVVVKPVGLALFQAFPVPAKRTVPPLKVRFFVPVVVVNDAPAVNVLPLRSTVPLARVTVLVDPAVMASCRAHVPPTPSNLTTQSKTLPFEVISSVPDVAAKVHVFPPAVKVAVDPKFMSP